MGSVEPAQNCIVTEINAIITSVHRTATGKDENFVKLKIYNNVI